MRRLTSVLVAALFLLNAGLVSAAISEGSLAAPGGLAPTGVKYNPTHWAVRAGDTITGTIVGATDVPDDSECSNGDPGVDVFIKSSTFGNTTLCGTLSNNNDTITFTWTVPAGACNTTNVAYMTNGNTTNNDLIDDG